MLAFKNDVSFWRSVDTMEGLSARTLVMNQVMEVVILLYLVEQDASWLVKITSILSLVLGVFKIAKSFRVRKLDAAKQGGGESLTDHYDKLAFRYLSPPLLLAVVGYSGHSLWYGYHRGWYAWILECMVALVYGGGFIVMTPQLFINYRLKSVAHLPWRFFMYKALNTFIDDLFAFIIKMPTMHRMSCFRDVSAADCIARTNRMRAASHTRPCWWMSLAVKPRPQGRRLLVSAHFGAGHCVRCLPLPALGVQGRHVAGQRIWTPG